MFDKCDGYIGIIITFGDELAIHRRGLYVSGSAHVTNGGTGGMMSAVGLELHYPRVSQAKFRPQASRRNFSE